MVRGEGNGHGGHAVLHDREQLDVRQMEVVSVTESLNKTSLRILAREIKLTKLDNLKNVLYLVYRKTIDMDRWIDTCIIPFCTPQ